MRRSRLWKTAVEKIERRHEMRRNGKSHVKMDSIDNLASQHMKLYIPVPIYIYRDDVDFLGVQLKNHLQMKQPHRISVVN